MKSIKFISLSLFVGLLAACGPQGQVEEVTETPADPSASAGEETIQEASLESSAWLTDYDQALAKAAEEGRVVLINFTGAEWCGPCIMLKRDVFETAEFKQYAENNLVLLELDYNQDGTPVVAEYTEQNTNLLMQHQPGGFPTLIVADASGEELDRHIGYMPGGPSNFIDWTSQAH
ncbi:MAG: thioredoxin family protein [Opitutales bacterium]